MKEDLRSKKDAKARIEQLGIIVKEGDVQVGRFFLVDNSGSKASISPFSVRGEGVTGLGVCFVYYYHGILTNSRYQNFIYNCMNFLIPEKKKKTYAIFVRAFGGRHSRCPEYVLKENSEMIRYDQPGHSFMAAASEWVVVDGEIVSAKKIFRAVGALC